MDKKIIIANWKMNPQTLAQAKALLMSVQNGLSQNRKTEVVFCPPFVFLNSLRPLIKGTHLGAQDVFYEKQGAFTGEISPFMLKDLGCQYVIIGHSERKQYFGETNKIINKKIKAVFTASLKPILCIGEKQRQAEGISDVLKTQIKIGLAGISERKIKDLAIAYEPVWAISTSQDAQACQPEDALTAGLFIRKILYNLFGRRRSQNIPILYGGSVNSQNAEDYIETGRLDGLLVGGASLKAGEFIKIIKTIQNY